MIKQLAIYGAGGFAREVAWLAEPPLLTAKKGLNPLEPGQCFGPHGRRRSGNGAPGLNPLEPGQCFGPMNLAIGPCVVSVFW